MISIFSEALLLLNYIHMFSPGERSKKVVTLDSTVILKE
jgi:hypothetical protein